MIKKTLRVLVILLLVIFIGSYVYGFIQQRLYLGEVNRVNIIHLQGTIESSAPGVMSGTNINPRQVSDKLERAARDNSIKGVVLRINTPGGSVAASQEIADMIRDFKKPIVISMSDTAASGGYYISAPADGIVAQPGTMTGSIGVIMTTYNPEELMDKIGIERTIIKSGKHKDMLSREMTAAEKEILQNVSDEAYSQFVAEVARGRNLSKKEVKDLATGRIYTGSQAKKAGLVDKLGGIEEAVNLVSSIGNIKNPVKYEYPPPGILQRMQGMVYQVSAYIKSSWLPQKLMIWRDFRNNSPYKLRYQLK